MKSLRSHLRALEEDIVGSDNRRLFCAWCVAVIVVISLGVFLNSDSVSILGVVESREYQVNFDRPVAIKQVHVFPGQNVKKGDLLLELNQSDLEMQLYILKYRLAKLSAELKLRDQISNLAQDLDQLPSGADPLKIEWRDTQREITLIEGRLKNLFVFAEVDGRVGGVNFKVGEKVPAFSPIVTLLPPNPTYVNGFINENLHSHIEVGQHVEVASVNGSVIQGRVVSLGSRIVPIPERLLRIQTLPAWGREIVVQIPPKNPLLIGEKVSVRRVWGKSFFKLAQADESPRTEPPVESKRVAFPPDLPDIAANFEPEVSGMVFIPELKQFVLVSDDYPKERPFLMLMTEQGRVQNRVLPLEGLDKIEAIESVSYQNSHLYLLSSLSATKKGKLKRNRQIFASILRTDMDFHLESQVDLRAALMQTFAVSSDPHLREILESSEDFEIEGHAIRNQDLYLALKNPLGQAREILILKVSNFERLFEKSSLRSSDVSVARRLQLRLSDKEVKVLVTDMIFLNDQIYLASSFQRKEGSAIWRIDERTGTVNLMQEFKRKYLEALAVLPKTCQLYGIFKGKEGNYLTTLSLPGVKKGSWCF